MYQTDRRKHVLHLEGKTYTPYDIRVEMGSPDFGKQPLRAELFHFLNDWFNDAETMTLQTSGSTGVPKTIQVRKQQMTESALATCSILNLHEGQHALLCLSVNFVAGKMMVIRALIAGLELHLVAPNGYPLQYADGIYDLTAMVPMQLYNTLQSAEACEKFKRIGTVLLGGAPLAPSMEQQLKDFPNAIYATYGMTETLSHIAMRRVNGALASEYFTPLPNIKLRLNANTCLLIDAPLICDERLRTNDRAEMLEDGRFRILGRLDNVINSGGLKIQTETLEAFLSDFLEVPFAISSLPDDKFGEIVVLAVEGTIDTTLLTQNLHAENLPAHEFPKQFFSLDHLPRTASGKINRAALRKLLLTY